MSLGLVLYIVYNLHIAICSFHFLLILGNTTPEHVKKIISKLASKSSCDVNGVSTRMIKSVGNEIALPLSHIFNLSVTYGKFPILDLKNAASYQFLRQETMLNVIITGQFPC